MTYHRILTVVDLPPEGPLSAAAREKADLDFKGFADPQRMWEHAKDIAAFANALGGVLLIGADDKTGQLVYPGLTGQSVKEVQQTFENAARLCSPSPVVDVVPIPEKKLVAVNVDPYPDQLVGAPVGTRDKTGAEKKHEHGWAFPVRRASQTEWIDPENLAMYMNRDVRRAVLLLAKVPVVRRDDVLVYFHRMVNASAYGTREVIDRTVALRELSVSSNYLELIPYDVRQEKCRVPLTEVMDVWETESLVWSIKIRGELQNRNGRNGLTMHYRPLPP